MVDVQAVRPEEPKTAQAVRLEQTPNRRSKWRLAVGAYNVRVLIKPRSFLQHRI